MKSNILNFKESKEYNELKKEYENGEDCVLKLGNYIIDVGEYLYLDNNNFYELTNLYFQRKDFQKYIYIGSIVRVKNEKFHMYKVVEPIKVKLIRKCENQKMLHYNFNTEEYTEII